MLRVQSSSFAIVEILVVVDSSAFSTVPFNVIRMFAGYRDEVEGPTAADDGVFIPQKELATWWKQLQKKYPSIYPPDEVR